MSRVFNISFPYGDSTYNALVTVKGGEDGNAVALRVEKEHIQLLLPHGKLTFPIVEVVNYFASLHQRKEKDMVMPITETISLHLMSNNW